MTDARPVVLTVCSANICRSPAMARLIAARLGPGVQVYSRGAEAYVGAQACHTSARWVHDHGGDISGGHAAAQLDVADAEGASLILTASRRLKARVEELAPTAAARTFTLLEAARLVTAPDLMGGAGQGTPNRDLDVAASLRWLVRELEARRAAEAARPTSDQVHPASGQASAASDDLPDPHRGVVMHVEVLTLLQHGVDTFCEAVQSAPVR